MNELTPREQATKAEGERLLKLAASSPGAPVRAQSVIAGPDGQPLAASETVQAEKTDQDRVKAMRAAHERNKARLEVCAKRMLELMESDKGLAELSSALLLGHRIISFVQQEMGFHHGVTDELVDYVNRAMHAKANDAAGWDLRTLESQVKHTLLPIMRAQIKKFEGLAALRKQRLKRLNSKLTNGSITLPGKLGKKFEKGFSIGTMLIVHGNAKAVRTALRLIAKTHKDVDQATVYALSADVAEPNVAEATTTMPLAWWDGAAASLERLYEILDPVRESDSGLVVVDSVEQLVSPAENLTPLDRKAVGIRSLLQWSVENMCSVVAGDVNSEDVPDMRVYGTITHVAAALDSVGDKPVLLLDEEAIEL